MDKSIQTLIDKYINQDDLSPKEWEILNSYFDEICLKPDILDSYTKEEKIHLQERIKQKIDLNILPESLSKQSSKKSYRLIYTAAACFLIVLFASLWVLRNNSDSKVITDAKNKFSLAEFHEGKIIQSKLQVKSTLLPDGSIIFLNKETEVILDKNFGIKDRKIQLKGEAYFDIAHNKNKPFIVYNASSAITVLGTRFWLNDKNEDALVTLLSGKINYSNEKTSYDLHPEVQISIDHQRNYHKQKAKNLEQLSLWKPEAMPLENISMLELGNFLSNRFQTPIRIANKEIENYMISTQITGMESLEGLLEEVLMVHQLSYKRIKNELIIYKT
ncbi:FecR family protein [Sphingobacterium kyonggiense]